MWVAFLLLGCTFVVAGSIVVTQSRGGWFAVVVGLAALACFLCLPRGWRWLGLPAAGVLAAAGMLVFYGGDVALLSRLLGDMTGKAGFRQELWTTGISALRDWGWTGMGFNFFRAEARLNYPFAMNVGGNPTIALVWDASHPHNWLLNVGVDLGVPGLIAFIALWLLHGAGLVRAGRQQAGWEGRVAWGLLAGSVALLVFGLSDSLPLGSKLGMIIWPMLALGQLLGVARDAGRSGAPA